VQCRNQTATLAEKEEVFVSAVGSNARPWRVLLSRGYEESLFSEQTDTLF
jgi:hypothetical protein